MKTSSEIRRARLLLLVEEAGGVQALADRVGRSQAQISQYKQGSPLPSGRPRGIGDEFARLLETSFDKPRGWMDTPITDPALPAPAPALTERERALLEAFDGLTADQQAQAIEGLQRQKTDNERILAELAQRRSARK